MGLLKVDEDAEDFAGVLAPPAHGVEGVFGLDDLGDEVVSRTGAALEIVDDGTEV